MERLCALLVCLTVFSGTIWGSLIPRTLPPWLGANNGMPTPPPPPGLEDDDIKPPPPPSPGTKVIESFHVKSDIRYRFATTQMTSVVRNTAEQAQEVSFDVTLPKEAFIVSFLMEIDGKIYDGEVKEKGEAKQQYQAAVDRGESAGHVREAPRHANIFEVSVNVAAESAVNFTLTYQEMLRRTLGIYEQEIHVEPGQAVEDFSVEIYIQENKPLKFVRTPALRTDALISNSVEEENDLTIVDRPTSETAYIKYEPTLEQQGDRGVSARFVVQYDVEHSSVGDVLVVDGYFIHFFAPELPSMPKDIIFVLDVSGSMYGKKIEQLHTAMIAILADLQPEDRFNIITFSSDVEKWKTGLVDAGGDNLREAKQFVKGMRAEGMTDINGALVTAITELRSREDKQRVPMIFFLTDGVPTVGIQEPEKIAANVYDTNGKTAAIFGLAFGTGADFESLKTICGQNSGFARKIYEASDAALQVASLYKEISAVAMKDISIDYLPSSVDKYTITDNEFPIIFNGSEVIICGRMADEAETFELEIKGLQKSGEVTLVMEVEDMNNLILDSDGSLNPFFTMPRDFAGIVEKMWAYLTIKQLLREMDRQVSDEVKVKELKKNILQMSLKYKFVTPLTSMVVTKPEDEDKPIYSGLKDVDEIPEVPQAAYMHGLPGAASGRAGPGGAYPYFSPANPAHNMPLRSFAATRQRKMGPKSPPFYSGIPTLMVDPVDDDSDSILVLPTSTMVNIRPTTIPTAPSVSPVILSSITTTSNNLTLCLAPRKIQDGTYNLFQSSNGVSVRMKTACANRACSIPVIEEVILATNTNRAVVLLSTWSFRANAPFSITQQDYNTLHMSGEGIEILIRRLSKRKGTKVSLEIRVESADSSTGVIGDILNMRARKLNKWRRRKAPGACRRQNADISKALNVKMARKYKI